MKSFSLLNMMNRCVAYRGRLVAAGPLDAPGGARCSVDASAVLCMPALFCDVVVAVCNVDAAEAASGFASPGNSNLLVADLEAFSAMLKSVDASTSRFRTFGAQGGKEVQVSAKPRR